MASAHVARVVDEVATAGTSSAPAQFSLSQLRVQAHRTAAELRGEFIALIRAGGVEPEALLRRRLDLDRVTAAAVALVRASTAARQADEVAAFAPSRARYLTRAELNGTLASYRVDASSILAARSLPSADASFIALR